MNSKDLLPMVGGIGAIDKIVLQACILKQRGKIKRIFHRVMVMMGKVEPEEWPVRSGQSCREVQITSLLIIFLAYQL